MRGVHFCFTCVYFASGSKCGLSTPLTSGELAGGKLVLLIALHSSSLALGKDGLSLTGGAKRETREERGEEKSEGRFFCCCCFEDYEEEKKKKKKKRPAQDGETSHAAISRPRLARLHETINPVTFCTGARLFVI